MNFVSCQKKYLILVSVRNVGWQTSDQNKTWNVLLMFDIVSDRFTELRTIRKRYLNVQIKHTTENVSTNDQCVLTECLLQYICIMCLLQCVSSIYYLLHCVILLWETPCCNFVCIKWDKYPARDCQGLVTGYLARLRRDSPRGVLTWLLATACHFLFVNLEQGF